MFDQNLSLIRWLYEPPQFVQLLCEETYQHSDVSVEREIDLGGGTLLVTANWLTSTLHVMPAFSAGQRRHPASKKNSGVAALQASQRDFSDS